jgi:hypothetical protein
MQGGDGSYQVMDVIFSSIVLAWCFEQLFSSCPSISSEAWIIYFAGREYDPIYLNIIIEFRTILRNYAFCSQLDCMVKLSKLTIDD